MYPLYYPWPLCIHGNSCLLGSTIGNLTMLEQTSDNHHFEKRTSIYVVCWPMKVGIPVVLYPCCTGVWMFKQGLHPFWLVLAESQYSVIVLNIYVSDNVYHDSFRLLSWWYVEPCWYFTAFQHSIVLIDYMFSVDFCEFW